MKCQYCGKHYKSEKWFKKHKCDKMYKLETRDNKIIKNAYMIWSEVLSIKNPNMDKFENSKQYKIFVKLSFFCENIKCINSIEYAKYLIENKIKEKSWCFDNTYIDFLKNYIRKENPRDAIERSIKFLVENGDFGSLMNKTSIGKIITYLENGRISPWLFVATDHKIKNRMNKEQFDYYKKVIGNSWDIKAKRYEKTLTKIKNELKGIQI